MTTITEDAALMKLRLELYGAAQLLKGDALEELKTLVREIAQVLDLDGGPKPLRVVGPKSTFEAGDVVRAKAGPPMTIENVCALIPGRGLGVQCAWFEGSTLHRWTFDPTSLEHTDERTPSP